MRVNIDDIVAEVLARLDEAPERGENVGGSASGDWMVEYGEPWYEVGALVRTLIPGEATRVVASADAADFTEWLPISGEVATVWQNGIVYKRIFPLPVDYMRFLYLRMSDWPEAVVKLADMRSEVRGMRKYWTCRDRGEKKSPMVSVGFHEGRRVLEIYGSVSGSRVAEGGYIPKPKVEEDGSLLFPSMLQGALVDRLVKTIREIRG